MEDVDLSSAGCAVALGANTGLPLVVITAVINMINLLPKKMISFLFLFLFLYKYYIIIIIFIYLF